jgi:hypothetical protein
VTTINNWKHRGIVKLRGLVSGTEVPEERRPAATRPVEIHTEPMRPIKRRAARQDTSGAAGSDAAPRSLFSWRASRDEVA